MADIYLHQKCQTVLSSINQIVGDQFSGREEETIYVPVYVNLSAGTISINTDVVGGINPELQYLQRFSSAPYSEQHHKTLSSSQPKSSHKEFSHSETLLIQPENIPHHGKDSVLSMSTNADRQSSNRKVKSRLWFPEAFTTDGNPSMEVSEEVKRLMKVNTKLRTRCLELTSGIKRMKLLVLSTGKFKTDFVKQLQNNLHSFSNIVTQPCDNTNTVRSSNYCTVNMSSVTDHNQLDSTSHTGTCISEPEHNQQQKHEGVHKTESDYIIEGLDEISNTNKKIRTNLFNLFVIIKQMKLMLLTMGEFKREDLKKLQHHLLKCDCMVNESYGSDIMRSYKLAVDSACAKSNYTQLDLSEPSTSQQTSSTAATQCLFMPQSDSSRVKSDYEYEIERPYHTHQIKKNMENVGKLLRQTRKIKTELTLIRNSVRHLTLMMMTPKMKRPQSLSSSASSSLSAPWHMQMVKLGINVKTKLLWVFTL